MPYPVLGASSMEILYCSLLLQISLCPLYSCKAVPGGFDLAVQVIGGHSSPGLAQCLEDKRLAILPHGGTSGSLRSQNIVPVTLPAAARLVNLLIGINFKQDGFLQRGIVVLLVGEIPNPMFLRAAQHDNGPGNVPQVRAIRDTLPARRTLALVGMADNQDIRLEARTGLCGREDPAAVPSYAVATNLRCGDLALGGCIRCRGCFAGESLPALNTGILVRYGLRPRLERRHISMSMPSFPNIDPPIQREGAVNQILSSIAMEELA